ncbi:hypothetical protein CSW98_10260 [Vibrio sp. HA2012]|uniref:GGDEF domain-containing protein n=1 Tax=Vibrio sp. HA2012 TaxID=1971595 RepID=UPI000C2BAD69|nr:sensor domain-containing diguanylate cyclase [Vibrio sp. HA2012]PJC86578.1 hypothetical protein CSW98_10260 [Vibrio sp. HA2012]
MAGLNTSQEAELELFRAVIGNNPDQIILGYESGIVIDVLPGTERQIQVDYSQLIGSHFSAVFPAHFCTTIQAAIDRALDTEQVQFLTYPIYPDELTVLNIIHSGESVFWFEARISALKLKHFDQRIIMWSSRDITQRVKLEKEVSYLVDYDELTGIFNRRRFLAQLCDAYKHFQRYVTGVSVVVMDIDDFKTCNDTYGHFSGDKAIHHVAQVCAKHLRECDFIGRLGGEEFAVILPDTDKEQALNMAERLRFLLESTPCQLDDEQWVTVTLSIGVSQFEPDDTSINDVLNRADQAMYRSKRNGKNQVSF